jgi:hypothetical protein
MSRSFFFSRHVTCLIIIINISLFILFKQAEKHDRSRRHSSQGTSAARRSATRLSFRHTWKAESARPADRQWLTARPPVYFFVLLHGQRAWACRACVTALCCHFYTPPMDRSGERARHQTCTVVESPCSGILAPRVSD